MAVDNTCSLPKRRKMSKNKKKSWKKIDIKEVDEFLEDERHQHRTGGLVAEKKNETLFFVDKEETKSEVVPGRRTRSKQPAFFKCYASLELNPLIKPVTGSHVKKRKPLSKQALKRLADQGVVAKRLKQLNEKKSAKNRKKAEQRKTNHILNTTQFDLWNDDIPTDKKDTNADLHYMTVTKRKRAKVPSTYHKKTTELPAIEVPPSGASYNPAYDDHQDLLFKANEVEEKKLKQIKKVENSLKFPTVENAPTFDTWLKEMSAGLNPAEQVDAESESDGDCDKISINPAVRREDYKTRQKRRKEKEQKILEQKGLESKKKKRTELEIYRLKSIKKEIQKADDKTMDKIKKRKDSKDQKMYTTRRLGRVKFEEPELPLKLGDELRGSLRLLTPEGNLMEDRYKSMQKRNIVEPRQMAKRYRKYKIKYKEKRSHKAITL